MRRGLKKAGAHQAVRKVLKDIREGYSYAVDIDGTEQERLLASCENIVYELRAVQCVSRKTGACFSTHTVDRWFDRLTMTIVILSLSKGLRHAHCGPA